MSVLGVLLLVPGVCYPSPVVAPVIDPFRPPACTWCAGNRGLEYGPAPGSPVTTVAAGVVGFRGFVAGVAYVVVEQTDGLRATYGRLSTISVTMGEHVEAGSPVGTSTDELFFGLRDGETYLDPAPMLGVWRSRARLVPTDGSPPRRAPPPRLTCGAGGSSR